MHIGNYVYVTNPDKELYRRRCKIIKIAEEGEQTKYLILSEGLEEEEWMLESDFEASKY